MAEIDYSKDYCRIVTAQPMTDDEVMTYYDIVQSVVHTKLVYGYNEDDDKVSVQVVEYDTEHGYVYEVALDKQVDLDEGEVISDLLAAEFEFDFDFESSIEI